MLHVDTSVGQAPAPAQAQHMQANKRLGAALACCCLLLPNVGSSFSLATCASVDARHPASVLHRCSPLFLTSNRSSRPLVFSLCLFHTASTPLVSLPCPHQCACIRDRHLIILRARYLGTRISLASTTAVEGPARYGLPVCIHLSSQLQPVAVLAAFISIPSAPAGCPIFSLSHMRGTSARLFPHGVFQTL